MNVNFKKSFKIMRVFNLIHHFCGKRNLVNTFIKRRYAQLSYSHKPGSEPLYPLTIGQLLEKSAVKYGDRPALISHHQNKSLTFRQLLSEADKFAAGLRIITQLEKGDRVGIWMPNIVEWETTFLACCRLGFIPVLLNPNYQAMELAYCIRKTGIKCLVMMDKANHQNYYNIMHEVVENLSTTNSGKIKNNKVPSLESVIMVAAQQYNGTFNYYEILNCAPMNNVKSVSNYQHQISFEDICNIQLTSGTTGDPKAPCLTHFSIVNNSYLITKRLKIAEKHHKICLQVPLFHTYGLAGGLLVMLHGGATNILPDMGFNPTKSLESIKKYECTVVVGTPTMYVDLVKLIKETEANICVDIACTGGSTITPKQLADLKQHLHPKHIVNMYGMTETSPVLYQSYIGDSDEKIINSVGHLADHWEAKLVDENGKTVCLGQNGELLVRGYGKMLEYWNDEEKSRQILTSNGWLRTGDEFIMYPDGYAQIVGRLKDVIIRGGENIYPVEIEKFLNSHSSILECQVVGLPHDRYGEEVCAVIRQQPNQSLNKADIVNYCKGKIAHFKIPSRVFIVNTYPKTTSGKIQKFNIVKNILRNDRTYYEI